MRLAPLDEAGLLKTGEPMHNVELYYRTLLASARAQVLNVDEEPIPGPDEAGELGCSLTSCPGGGSRITDCIVFGRIAGRNVAAEESWG